MRMSRLKSVTLALLLVATLIAPISANVGASGPKSMVDFTIEDISIGNSSVVAFQWDQPDGTQKDYFLKASVLPIQVTFKQAGSSLQTTAATGFIEVWHPVGVKVAEWNYSLSLSGGQSVIHEVVWTAEAAHSHLDENGTLSGGYIIKGVVDAGIAEGDTSNDVTEEHVPIAIFFDNMEKGMCGDNDGDTTMDCPGETYYNPTFASVGLDANDQTDGHGPWQMDESSGFVGTKHWRHSVPGQDYVSNGNDHIVWGWLIPGGTTCEDPGHGLGWGITANELNGLYSAPFCKVSLTGGNYISMQLATQAWGGLGLGNDEVSIEATSAGAVIATKNLSESGISSATDDWTPVIWDVGANTSTQVFSLSYHFKSDNSGASAGFHVDQFALFGIEKVQEYTITVNCDNPETGYLVIPADPLPPSLHCTLTNNGYREKALQILSLIDNETWMNQYSPIRIDSNNINDHDYSVPLNPIGYNETTEFWVNLTIPPGSNVEQLEWNVSLLDYYTGEAKEIISIPLSVGASYSVDITHYNPSVVPNIAPDESELVKFRLSNTGNQMAYWNLNAYFNRSDWGSSHYRFLDADVNGSEITFMQLSKGEDRDFWAEFTSPTMLSPGLTEVTIQAEGQSPATAQKTRKISINTPQVNDLTMVASELQITAEADGRTRIVEIELTNNGNAPERFDLSLTADWRLGASVSQPVTEEIGSNGDSSTILLVMPMPYGIRPDTYFLTVRASSQENPSFFKLAQVELIVEPTYLINVEDVDMSGQTFQGGADVKTISFEVTNNGNDYDEFTIEIDAPVGMNAEVIQSDQYNPNSPPSVAQGSSVNITVEYSFDIGTNGLLEMVVSARSVQSGGVAGGSGSATFQVGSQGWIDLTPGTMVTLDAEGWILANLTIHNRHPTNSQFIRLDVDPGDARQFSSVRVQSEDSSFVLDPDMKRSAAIKFSLTETQFLNMPEDEMLFNITVIATGDDDVSETVVQVKVIRDSLGGANAEAEGGIGLVNIIAFIIGGIVIIALIVVLAKVVMSTNREEDEILSLEGYQRQLEDTYGSMPSAPDIPVGGIGAPSLPVTDQVANSAYGGAADIFEQQMTTTPAGSPPAGSPPAGIPPEPPQATPPAGEVVPDGAPPLPPGGLPNGWDMSQWVHYGEQYLEQQGLK